MIKLCKITAVELDDGRTIHIKEIPLEGAAVLVKFEDSKFKDFISLAELLKLTLVNEDGSELTSIASLTAKQLCAQIPIKEAMMLFTEIGKVAGADLDVVEGVDDRKKDTKAGKVK